MLTVTIRISGSKELHTKLRKMGREFYQFRNAMTQIGVSLKEYYSSVGFASQGGVFGKPWARLSPAYAARKAKRYPGRPPMIASGRMQGSFYSKPTDTSVEIGNTAPQFPYHQSTAQRTKMPYRPMMGKNQAVLAIIQNIIQKDVENKLRSVGLS